ncbi:ImmA/IrrE family metallo-endopeptidase [Mariniblastus sp.]|nr:ImmA/IrrE family metallo-endopeptidase [Mariniblastus sp.]
MNAKRKQLVLAAAAKAATVRRKAKVAATSPINIFDFCEKNGASVFFQDIPSMEGVYMPDASPKPAIVVSSLRPAGRKAMTCGHEYGHHLFEHGHQWDELIEERNQSRKFEPEEFLVDVFSSCIQMPKTAVSNALSVRGIDLAKITPQEAFNLSCYFGVSYGGFIHHTERTLNLLGMQQASEILKKQPKNIRAEILGEPCPQDLVVADLNWLERTIDVEVGDSIILPSAARVEGHSVETTPECDSKVVATATTPGISRAVHDSGWCAFIRVSRKDYVGRAAFRFDEEVDDEH